MIDKFLKIAGVNNIDDFYKLHPTEDHFFKAYPNAKKELKKSIRRPKAEDGGNIKGAQMAIEQKINSIKDPKIKERVRQTLNNNLDLSPDKQIQLIDQISKDTNTGYWDRMTSIQHDRKPDPRAQSALEKLVPFYGKKSDGFIDWANTLLSVPQNIANDILTGYYEPPGETTKRYNPNMSPITEGLVNAATDPLVFLPIADAAGAGKVLSKASPYAKKVGKYIAKNIPNKLITVGKKIATNPKVAKVASTTLKGAPGAIHQISKIASSKQVEKDKELIRLQQENEKLKNPNYFQQPVDSTNNTYSYVIPETNQPPKDSLPIITKDNKIVGYLPKGYIPRSSSKNTKSMTQEEWNEEQKKLHPERFQDGGEVNNDQEEIFQTIYEAINQNVPDEEIINYLVNKGVDSSNAPELLQRIKEQLGQQEFAYGGINITPSKKGTFTAQATKMHMGIQEAARHILANKGKYSSAMIKKANFARNAAKWKHQEGGETIPQEQMEAPQQQMQEEQMGQEQLQGGQDQMMQQLVQMVTQALQQGTPPKQIIQMLVQQGIPEQVAVQAVQMVMQQMQSQGGPGQQYQPQGNQYQGPQPIAAYGGYYQEGGFNDSSLPFDYNY